MSLGGWVGYLISTAHYPFHKLKASNKVGKHFVNVTLKKKKKKFKEGISSLQKYFWLATWSLQSCEWACGWARSWHVCRRSYTSHRHMASHLNPCHPMRMLLVLALWILWRDWNWRERLKRDWSLRAQLTMKGADHTSWWLNSTVRKDWNCLRDDSVSPIFKIMNPILHYINLTAQQTGKEKKKAQKLYVEIMISSQWPLCSATSYPLWIRQFIMFGFGKLQQPFNS